MTDTLKDAKPSGEAFKAYRDRIKLGDGGLSALEEAYEIDVAPLIAERDALRARVAELVEENEAHETQNSTIIRNYFDLGKELGVKGSPFEAVMALKVECERFKDWTWFWQIVDENGLENVCSDERGALQELCSMIDRFTKERDEARDYAFEATRTITGLTVGGSEFFAGKLGDRYKADLPFCEKHIRERLSHGHDAAVRAVRERKAAESSLAASRRQVEGLKEALEPFAKAWDAAIEMIGGKPLTLAVVGAIAAYFTNAVDFRKASAALSALDAPQMDPGYASLVKDWQVDILHGARPFWEVFGPNQQHDAPQPDAVIAEAVEIIRAFAPEASDDGRYMSFSIGAGQFIAARAFVEKHSAPRDDKESGE